MPDCDLSPQSAGSARFHRVPQHVPLFPPKVSSGCTGLFEGSPSIMESLHTLPGRSTEKH